MDIERLNYDLPAELIAQKPAQKRDASRLLVLDRNTGSLTDSAFARIIDYLNPGDCLTLNNTKVLNAKFFAERKSGAKLEGLFLFQNNANNWQVMLKNASRLKTGEEIVLIDRDRKKFCPAVINEKFAEGQWLLTPQSELNAEEILSTIGFAPLPPYIKRDQPEIEHNSDTDRYQTVYAKDSGAVAAPTAGLHFTTDLLEKIKAKGVKVAQITLHVGQGTFLPVKTKTLEEHKIHSERFSIDAENAKIINETIKNNGRIIAVGTTTVRTLETIATQRSITPKTGQTNLFIMPGFEFKITDCLITNFHLPKSTLLALVGAFAGMDKITAAYKHAVEQKYRFYSYGDCMIII